MPVDPNCPYPPSDPFCQTPRTTTTSTTIQHVIIDNGFQGAPQYNVTVQDDAVKQAIDHQTHTIEVGFTVVVVVLVALTLLLAAFLPAKRPS